MQGIAFRRGNDESNDNFHQILKLLANNGVVGAKLCLTTSKHLSHGIVNELCNLIGHNITRSILNDFKSQRAISKYAVLANKKKDSSGVEQLTVCFRWVGKDLYVHEDFMGIYS